MMDDLIKETVFIKTEYIKLDAFLKFCGAADTGGRAKIMVEEGDVLVNGESCVQRGRKIYPGMTVSIKSEGTSYGVKSG